MSETYKETESERYQKQLIRINQIGIYGLILIALEMVELSPYYELSTTFLCGLLISFNSLAFFYSATGVNPSVWVREKLQDHR